MINAKFKLWIPIWVIPVLIIMAIGTVWLRLSIVRITYSIGQVDHQLRGLAHEREQAELRLAGLRSPRRLEALARSKFKLTQPTSEQIVYFK